MGRWSFPRPPRPSPVAGLAPEGPAPRPPGSPRRDPRANLHTFAPLRSRTDRPDRFLGLLSGFTRTSQPREPGGVPVAPPSTCSRSVHSCDDGRSSLRPRGCHPRSPVPSSWFLTTSTASSAPRVAGLLHPAADPGVHRVSARGFLAETRHFLCFPAVQVEPLEGILADSRTVSPRPLPPCRSLPDHRHASPGPVAGSRSVVVGGSGASASRPCSVVESGEVPLRCRRVDDPLLPGLRSSPRSFALGRRSRLPPCRPSRVRPGFPGDRRVERTPFRIRSAAA